MSSRREYLSQAELAQYANITITDATEADDQISQAEEIIDDFVGYQERFMEQILRGLLATGGMNNLLLEQVHQNNMQLDYLAGCWIQIIGGTGKGQQRKITGQTLAGVITVEADFTVALDTTSYYEIWQLGKFPRKDDVNFDGIHTPQRYYKNISEKVTRAVAAQVEYMIQMGSAFFASDKLDMQAESLGDYSYSKGKSAGIGDPAASRVIAPKARILLRGIWNRTGSIL